MFRLVCHVMFFGGVLYVFFLLFFFLVITSEKMYKTLADNLEEQKQCIIALHSAKHSVFSLQKCSKHQNGSDAPHTRYVTREVFESLSASRDEAVSKQPSAGHPHELVRDRFGLGAGTGEVRGHGMESQFRQRPLRDVHKVKFTAA